MNWGSNNNDSEFVTNLKYYKNSIVLIWGHHINTYVLHNDDNTLWPTHVILHKKCITVFDVYPRIRKNERVEIVNETIYCFFLYKEISLAIVVSTQKYFIYRPLPLVGPLLFLNNYIYHVYFFAAVFRS